MGAPEQCPACGGRLHPWRTVAAGEPDLAPIPLLRCARCGTAVTDAPPAQELHETGAYRGSDPRLSRLARPVLDAFDRQRLRILAAVAPPPGRLVDAGAGRGRFLAAARAAGYDARGLEPSRRGVEAGRLRYGVELEPVTVEEARVAPGSLDVVTLWHVLEHLDDPAGALERVAAWLRPGGTLLVAVPNLDSVQARLGGARWYHLDVPRHRTHFTPRGLEELLRVHGLDPQATHQMLAEHNPFGLWQTLVNRATRTPSYLFHVLKRNAPLRSPDLAVTLLALPLAPLAAVVELVAGLAGRGGTIAVIARKA